MYSGDGIYILASREKRLYLRRKKIVKNKNGKIEKAQILACKQGII